jgi:hypothetical protein
MRVNFVNKISQILKIYCIILNKKQCNVLEDSFNKDIIIDLAHMRLKYNYTNLD